MKVLSRNPALAVLLAASVLLGACGRKVLKYERGKGMVYGYLEGNNNQVWAQVWAAQGEDHHSPFRDPYDPSGNLAWVGLEPGVPLCLVNASTMELDFNMKKTTIYRFGPGRGEPSNICATPVADKAVFLGAYKVEFRGDDTFQLVKIQSPSAIDVIRHVDARGHRGLKESGWGPMILAEKKRLASINPFAPVPVAAKPVSAYDSLRADIAKNPTSPQPWVTMGTYFESVNDLKWAKYSYQKALSLDATNAEALQGLQRLGR